MDYTKKITELRSIINERLLHLIDNDYIYLDLPYYSNIGDLLIWEGTLNFLSQTKHRCLYSTNADNFKYRNIDKNVIIILNGGGNWGDLWVKHHNFRKKIVEMYPNNRIIVFPQSIYYQDESNLKEDIEFYNKYPNVTVCTRDNKSFEIMTDNFLRNKTLLVPDMAFYIDVKYKPKTTSRILFAKRNDKEFSLESNRYINIPKDAEVHDWPTYEINLNKLPINWMCYKFLSICRRLEKVFNIDIVPAINDFYWKTILKRIYIKMGISFISNYKEIYSTRLHISILSILMGKKIYIIDNNYNKTRNLITTWFSEEECSGMLK